MIRFLFLLGGTFILSSPFFAQKNFEASLKMGLTASQISGDNKTGFGQFGMYAGSMITYPLKNDWSMASGIFFNQKGARRYQSLGNVSTYRLRVNYIDVPILMMYHWKDFNFSAGSAFNVKINQRERTEFGEIEDERIFKPIELAFQLGAGYTISDKLRLHLNYQNSILPVRIHGENYIVNTIPNSIVEEWHQTLLNKGQYFSSLSLMFAYRF